MAEKEKKHKGGGEECNCGHEHSGDPFANLDEETQAKIQELQMLEHHFQQLLMQKNAFSMEDNETNLILKETEKSEGEIFRIIGSQVAIKSTKEKTKDFKRLRKPSGVKRQ